MSATLRVVLAALAVMLAAPGAALAQSTSDIPPPVRYLSDENGIDVARGEHLVNITDLSIGPIGQGGLAYGRQLRRTGGGNPYDLGLFQIGSNWTASVGLRSYSFTEAGGAYTSTDGSGATLVQSGTTRTLTLSDGTIIVYDYNVIATSDSSRKSRATSITHPNGERVDIAWVSTTYCSNNSDGCSSGTQGTAVRLQAVSSPAGYQLHFNYGLGEAFAWNEYTLWRRLDSISAINTTVDECDPFEHSCTLSQAWPTAEYSTTVNVQTNTVTEVVTDPEDRTSSYATSGNVFSIRRPASSAPDIVYTYGTDGKIDTVVRDGLTWSYNYSVAGNFATMVVTDPGSHQRTIVSDLTVGLPTSVTNEVNQETTYTYDTSGRLRRATAPEDNYVEYSYDARGNVTEVRRRGKGGNSAYDLVITADYPDTCDNPLTCNQPTSTTDANLNTTDYTYSPNHGGVWTVTAPAPETGAVRPQVRYSYQSFTTPGNTTVVRLTTVSQCQTQSSCNGTSNEVETVIAYVHDNLLPSSVTRRNGTQTLSATETYGYDAVGNLLTVDGPLSGTADTVRIRYNLARQVTGRISADPDGTGALEPRAQRVTISATSGLVTRIENGTVNSQSDADWGTFSMSEQVDIEYDSAERPVLRTLIGLDEAPRAQTQLSYDNEGRLQCTAVRMNTAEYDDPPADACTLDTQGSVGRDRITRTSYDAANRVNLVQTGYGITSLQADEVATVYTANGRVFHVTDANDYRTTYEYDGHDRLIKTRFPLSSTINTSSTTDYEQLTLDDNGNVTEVALRDALQNDPRSIVYGYDALNRLIEKDLPGSEPTVTYSYDNLGRMTGASRTGHALTFTYDALGRNLTQSGPLGTSSYQYDLAGRRTRLTYPGGGLYVDYDYLVTGEVTAIRENGATSGIGVLAVFGYDQMGRRTLLSRGNGTSTTYDYDPVSRLEQLVQSLPGTSHDLTLDFTYNPASQIATNTRSNNSYSYPNHVNQDVDYTNNGRNELTNIDGATSVTYDTRRNVTAIGSSTFTYNSENMLTSGGGVSYVYDPLMRLYQASNTRFVHDRNTIIAEYGSAGPLLRRFVHGPGVDEPLVWYEGDDTSDRRFFHADERGSIIAISDDVGTVIGTNRYDEYGMPVSPTTGRFQYTGQVWIASAGMYYYRARFYNPSIGRFMQTDPIGYGGGMNLYAYVGNDPVNFTDPSGLTQDDFPPPKCIGYDYCGNSGFGSGFSGENIIVWGDMCRVIVCNPLEDLDRIWRTLALHAAIGSSTGERGASSLGEGAGEASCSIPAGTGNVHLEAVIGSPPVGPAYITGTITDPSTGASASFHQIGVGGITGLAGVRLSGTVTGGFGALSQGIDIHGYVVTAGRNVRGGVGGGGAGSATLRTYGGALIGTVDASVAGLTPGVSIGGVGVGGAAFGYDFSPPSIQPTSC